MGKRLGSSVLLLLAACSGTGGGLPEAGLLSDAALGTEVARETPAERGASADLGADAGLDLAADRGADRLSPLDLGPDLADVGADLAGPGCAPLPSVTAIPYTIAPELAVSGDLGSVGGIFDPSVVYPVGAAAGAMSYSSVESAHAIRTRIALSADQGATWHTVTDANAPQAMSIDSTDLGACPSGTCSGTVINEVSSLIFDVDDPDVAQRWKLFTHRYMVLPSDQLRYDMGHIAMAVAAKVEGPWTAPAPLIGWPSSSSFSSKGVVLNTGDVPQLAGCVALSEPGAIWLPGVLNLALTCVRMVGGSAEISIILLRSTDHAASFHHVSTLISAAQGTCFSGGIPRISAPALFVAGGKEYLIASPEGAAGYRGCLIFPVEDPATGLVARDSRGNPAATRFINASADRFNGACTYAEGATAMGYGLSVAFLEAPTRQFRIFPTRVSAP